MKHALIPLLTALTLSVAACTASKFSPEIPSLTTCITDFGAVPGGDSLNTACFSEAIDWLEERGGGHLIVPEGVWLTGPITLKDRIDLHIEKGATILFSTDRDLYPIVETVFEGLDTRRCLAQINAYGATDISITGEGTVDGQGDDWRQVKKSKLTDSEWEALLARGGFAEGNIWYPDSSSWRGSKVSDAFNVPQGLSTDSEWESVKTYLRPVLLEFTECDNILLEGVCFCNSPCWNLHPLLSRNVNLRNLSVKNPWYSQNGDGLDVDSCDGVMVEDCTFDVGDDAICIKSGKDADGRRRARPCRNVCVKGCTVYHGHGGFVVGSEMSGGVENVCVSSCEFIGTDVGLRFKSCRGRGGVVSNILINDIKMRDIATEPLLFDLHYGGKSAVEAAADGDDATFIEFVPADETTPQFRDITITDISCEGAARAMYFNGIPEMPIENIVVRNCRISSRKGADIRYSRNVTLENCEISVTEGEAFTFSHCENINR